MTLNNIIFRIESFCNSHRLIKSFKYSNDIDWMNLGDITYPAVFLSLKNGNISTSLRQATYNFQIFFCDLEYLPSEEKRIQQELESDLSSIAQDFITMLKQEAKTNSDFNLLNETFNVEFLREQLHDLTVSVYLQFSISTKYSANRCAVPSDNVNFQKPENMFIDILRIEAEDETDFVQSDMLKNKKVLMCFLGDKNLNEVTTAPTVEQFKVDATTGKITFGIEKQQGQLIQVLYRTL